MIRIEFEQEGNGRWIAEIPALPGVMAYGATQNEARAKVEALALRIFADRLEQGEAVPELTSSLLLHEPLVMKDQTTAWVASVARTERPADLCICLS